MVINRYDVIPVSKPRMTQRDRWAKRPAVLRYFDYCDQVRELGIELPNDGYHVIFLIPMAKSWSKKKRAEMNGTPHTLRPDKDNLEKALMDAVLSEDCAIWDGRVTKLWFETGHVIVKHEPCNHQELLASIKLEAFRNDRTQEDPHQH